MDTLGSGAAKYLSQFSDVTSVLGSFSFSDPVSANAGRPWLFASDILVDIKGSSAAALVLTDFGGWSAPPMLAGSRFRRLRVDIYQDAQRDAIGNVTSTTEGTISAGQAVFAAVHARLQRRDMDTVLWGDMVTFSCQLLTDPLFSRLPDGDWAMVGTAYYGVSFSGWTDVTP